MQNILKQALSKDKTIINSRNKTKAILLDLIPNESQKINLFSICVDSGIVKEMQNYSNQTINNYLFDKWIDNLVSEWGLQKDNAIWALEQWAKAFDIKLPKTPNDFSSISDNKNTSVPKPKKKKQPFNQTVLGKIFGIFAEGFLWATKVIIIFFKNIFFFVFDRLIDNILYAFRRFIAAIIDFIVIILFSTVITTILEIYQYFIIVFLLIAIIYFAKMESSDKNATWGKRMLGLSVYTNSGYSLNFLRALGRAILKLIISIPSIIGVAMILFSKDGKALHDILTATEVEVE